MALAPRGRHRPAGADWRKTMRKRGVRRTLAAIWPQQDRGFRHRAALVAGLYLLVLLILMGVA
ncbi:hypothetical protein CV103_12665 [Sphingomonas fennica]|uniref:Uncharacterized protein n=1 Tax=Edaphosphingomonas fennica TaxID=114404 RepID=A0A2T4HW33_9SPHN|nr:hypothetical protein [Sphingomonas sp.]PTD20016.1 hypothetical protein CV103_12665 [Sphingomonas fennica]